jgi:alkanesulfonate monooxygenase SsuD/methylene tetrahydromethanopterin reductase-like flavin-dependent oxidoreductase (luciferase family)
MFEAWLVTAAWAQATERVRIGLMVGANTFRNPALVAKMATTLDHLSNGRAILGIGAAWFGEEHEAFGLEFGSGPPERLRWLAEALPVIRGMLDGIEPTAAGPHYAAKHVRNVPAPVQAHLPICIGGGGEQVTLKLVARYADMNNVGGGVASVRRKEEILLRHCEAVGRDLDDRADDGVGTVFIRDDRAEAERAFRRRSGNGAASLGRPAGGDAGGRGAAIAPLVELGYRHLIMGAPAPYDENR